MDERIIQRTRYILRSRFRRVQTLPNTLFFQAASQLFEWLTSHQILSSSIDYLDNIPGGFVKDINQISEIVRGGHSDYPSTHYEAKSFEIHAAICMRIVKNISQFQKINYARDSKLILLLAQYINSGSQLNVNDSYDHIRNVALEGLFEYLDERIDTTNAIYGILHKYKQRSEWLHQSRLRNIAEKGLEGKFGERALAIDLQEYILDQGVEFFIEPVSSSGEVDLLLRDSDGRYLIIDAKYIPDNITRSKIKNKLSSGFNQIARYCTDFNEPEGFLVVFLETDYKLQMELDEIDGKRYLLVGGKRAYYYPINIADLHSASQEGKAKSFRFSREDLISESV